MLLTEYDPPLGRGCTDRSGLPRPPLYPHGADQRAGRMDGMPSAPRDSHDTVADTIAPEKELSSVKKKKRKHRQEEW